MRLDAYYYGFDATGERSIDVILSAVACAGKAFHHTESWTDDSHVYEPDHHRGANPVEWIQNAANDARAELAALRQRAEDAEAIVRAIFDADLNADHPFDWYFDGDGKIQFPGRFVLDFDRATGLPILTDEAREALKKNT